MFGLDKELTSKVEKHSSRFYKVLKSSLKAKNEDLLIISDYGKGSNNLASMLAYGYYHAAKNKGFNVNLLFQDVKKGFMFADDHVIKSIERLSEKNLVILCLSNKLGRFGKEKSFRNFCKDRGHRFLSATGLGDVNTTHFNLFLEAMNTNYKRMKKRGLAIKKLWDKANEIQVKTEAGTDITFNVPSHKIQINGDLDVTGDIKINGTPISTNNGSSNNIGDFTLGNGTITSSSSNITML